MKKGPLDGGRSDSPEKILRVPLEQVAIDPKWNSRSPRALWAEGEDETENTLAALLQSIREKGQCDPIDVIASSEKGFSYFAITGFRRAEAIRLLAQGWEPSPSAAGKPTFNGPKNDHPTIRVVVRDYDSLGARIRNLSENTSRSALSAADVAFGVREILKIDKTLTAEQTGRLLGLSKSYAAKLYWIARSLKSDIFNDWRESPGSPATLAVMYVIAKMPQDEQQNAYERELAARKRGERGRSGDWVGAAMRRAAAVGEMLGNLEREYQLNVSTAIVFSEALEFLVQTPVPTRASERKKIVQAMEDSFRRSRDR